MHCLYASSAYAKHLNLLISITELTELSGHDVLTAVTIGKLMTALR